jgi:phospholipid/cholesterol/gamma-HCH transport system substrate-binding protein
MTSGATWARVIAVTAVVFVAGAIAIVLLRDSSYTIHARFSNAGLLVKGGRVEVAGRAVGSISKISLTPDGQADVELAIDDNGVRPLRRGTRAAIRAVGQAGITNRFVDLSRGPNSQPALGSGAVLGTDQTSGIVNLDAILDSFGPTRRANIRELLANSAQVYAGSGARSFNQMLGKLDPALAELDGMWGDLADDRVAVGQLVRTAGDAATAISRRRRDLVDAVRNTAVSFGALARERGALADILERMPAFLRTARGTLARTGTAVTALRPALRDVPRAAGPLREYLARLQDVVPRARPVVAQLRAQLPGLGSSLSGLRPLERPAVGGLQSTGGSMRDARPMLAGLRFYGSDLILGVLAGLVGVVSGPYDGYGHYAKANFVQSPQTLPEGPLASLLSAHPLVPGVLQERTGLTRRCPGGNVPPARDGSSPWPLGASLCTSGHDMPASVNEP